MLTSDQLPRELSRTPGLWEPYTRRFIMINRLDPDQTRRAWQTLRTHQKTALKWLSDHEDQIKKVDADIARSRAALAAADGGVRETARPSQTGAATPPTGAAELPTGEKRADTSPSDENKADPSSEDRKNTGVLKGQADGSRENAKNGGASTPEALRRELAALEERRNKLLDPIDDIFRTKLQPDLFDLLTPEQKASLAKRQSDLAALKDAAQDTTREKAPASDRRP